MDAYSVYVQKQVFDVMAGMRKNQRLAVELFIDSLEGDPFQSGDFTETDAADRPLSFQLLGNHVVAFWTDHAVREVKVVSIDPAD